MKSINAKSLGIGILFGFMFAMLLVVVVFARNDNSEHQATINNILSWTVGDLNNRLGNADFRLGRAIEDPQDPQRFADANASVASAAGILQNLLNGIPLDARHSANWYTMSRALFRASSELERMRVEVTNNQTLSDQNIARLQEMRDLVGAIKATVETSEVLGRQGVRFDENAINQATAASNAF